MTPGAVVATFIYCILWFIVQDCVKVGTYALIDKYFTSAHTAIIAGHAEAHSADALPDAEHPLSGVDTITARAQRAGAIATQRVGETAQGTVHLYEPHAAPAPRSTIATLFSPRPDPAAGAHAVHAAALPNNVDLTAVVLASTKSVTGASLHAAAASVHGVRL